MKSSTSSPPRWRNSSGKVSVTSVKKSYNLFGFNEMVPHLNKLVVVVMTGIDKIPPGFFSFFVVAFSKKAWLSIPTAGVS